MPTIPKAQTGQDFCTAQEYKIFMQDAQDWANLQSKDYGQLVQAIYMDPVDAKVDGMITAMDPCCDPGLVSWLPTMGCL